MAFLLHRKYAIILLLLLVLGGLLFVSREPPPPQETLPISTPIIMRLESSTFQHNQPIPSKYTCDGEDVSPPLKISDVPVNAQSLALIMDDPDAPRGTWLHWTIWNIAPDVLEIAEASVPQGVTEGMTDFGRPGYGGPCPPSGTHRYFFRLYALDTMLTLAPGAERKSLEQAFEGHTLATAELVGLYQRK